MARLPSTTRKQPAQEVQVLARCILETHHEHESDSNWQSAPQGDLREIGQYKETHGQIAERVCARYTVPQYAHLIAPLAENEEAWFAIYNWARNNRGG